MFAVVAVAAFFLGDLLPAVAAPPSWTRVFSRNRIEADPDEIYPLSEDHGPWMVMATTFTGDDAAEEARELVHELRSRYKLKAYTYQKKFELESVQARGFDRYGEPLRMRYQSGNSITEIAVLVGDFTDASDAAAQKALHTIKYARPDALTPKDGDPSNQTLSQLRSMQAQVYQKLLPDGDERKHKGPMGHAFISTNPLLPPEYFVPKGLDKMVVDMNKGLKHSLLDCTGKYTIRVATFTGQVVIDQKKIQEIESGKRFKSTLDEAAEKAHKLTARLRKDGVEAYEFHDRYQSIVTVGSFDTVGSPRADGKIEINPAMFKIIQTYGAETKMQPGQSQPQVGSPKTIAGITLDLSPIPVEVPRRSIAADYGRTVAN
jgi:hypothetical protein